MSIELPSGRLSSEVAGPEQPAINGPFGELMGNPARGPFVAIPLRKHSRGKRFVVLDTKSFCLLGGFAGITTITCMAVSGDKAFSEISSLRLAKDLGSKRIRSTPIFWPAGSVR